MILGTAIYNLRNSANLSQEQFAKLFDVSQQSVQKWENGDSTPELGKIIKIAQHFDVSLDALILGNNNRVVEEMRNTSSIKPQYDNIHSWEFYPSNLALEYTQSMEEGLDIEEYKDLFLAISRLPRSDIKEKLGDVLFDIVINAPMRKDYKYVEPSDIASIKNLRKPYAYKKNEIKNLESKIRGAWMGRICGCMLGKTVEGIRTNELIPFLKETGNYPMHRYILKSDLEKTDVNKYKYAFWKRYYADSIDGMPADDDTNYTVLYQKVIEKYGRDFTPFDVSRAWLSYQSINAYCTAERVAYCNFVKGFAPPDSAKYKNAFREWIGAQIRADYFGYINPGNPELAADMAFRDASISHIKNGIYGEMFVAAMLAVAAETNDIKDIILAGLAEVPCTSRLYEEVMSVVNGFEGGVSQSECFKKIHEKYDEHSAHDWCHTNSNAMIVAASLLYGKGDYSKSICMSVETGFDTDCNGATVGSILGLANGIESIPTYWQGPINNKLNTAIFGMHSVMIDDLVALTMKHIDN